jgi:hypothetical protein
MQNEYLEYNASLTESLRSERKISPTEVAKHLGNEILVIDSITGSRRVIFNEINILSEKRILKG